MRWRPIAAAGAALALLASPAALAVSKEAAIESFTLANGLEVIVLPNHRIPAVSQMIWYRVGAADDPPGKSGLAHFHEHAMFLGTAAHKGGEYASLASSHGGDQNAFTTQDATGYFLNLPKEELPLAMELEADRMHDLTPGKEAITREREVIIEERRMRVDNSPEGLLGEQMGASLFRNHPYHRPVIGWKSEMERLNEDDVLAFHKRWYHPNNAILILSGDITAAEAKPMVEKYYGGLPKVAVPERKWLDEPPQDVARELTMHHPNVRQPGISRSYAAASLAYGKKEEALPLFVLSEILGEGKTSRLYQSLVVEQKLASAVDTSYGGLSIGPSTFDIDMVPDVGVDPKALEKALDAELAKFIRTGVSAQELARAKTKLKAETVYARDSLTGVARIMGWIRMCGLDKDYFTRWPQMIDAVTPAQVMQAAKDTLKPGQSVTAFLLPEEKP